MKKLVITLVSLALLCMLSCSYGATLHVTILGIQGELLTNVKAALQAKQSSLPTPFTNSAIQTFHQEAPTVISQTLQPYGYFRPKIAAQLTAKNNNWHAVYSISTGTELKIVKLDVRITGAGANYEAFQKLRAAFPLQPGQTLNIERYNLAKQKLFDTAYNYGFLNAALVEKNINIDLEKYQAVITLHFDTGPRYFFGDVTFSPSPFSPDFLHRFLNFTSGEPYSQNKLDDFRASLNNSALFQSIDVIPKIEHITDGRVPIKTKIIPRPGKQYSLGLGYGTDTGVRGLLGLELRHLTAAGHSFKSTIKVSERENNLEAHYLIPGRHPATEQYDLSTVLQTEDQDRGNSTALQAAAAYLSLIKNWQQTLKLSVHEERYHLKNHHGTCSFLLIPSAGWTRTIADDPIIPNHGYEVNFNLKGASKVLLSSTDFLQAQLDGKYITTFGKRLQLVFRAAIGYTAITNINDLPLSLQYFAGGMQSVRGYEYNSLGPGKALAVGSMELRYLVLDKWYATTFFDAGNVNNKFLPPAKKGVGIGVIWRSPIGLAELSYARALDLKGHPGKIQFSIGPEF
jgi:translocation and assembly module TamA